MLTKPLQLVSSLYRSRRVFEKCISLVVYKRNFILNAFSKTFLVATAARPFSVSSCVFPRVQTVEYLPVTAADKQEYPIRKGISKRLRGKKKKDKLKAKLDERLESDKLEAKINTAVDVVKRKLKLDESSTVSVNMNIDYLISEGIPVEVISKIAEKSPKSLNLELSIIKKRIKMFKINSLYEDSIRKCLKRNPSLLLCKLEDTLSQKVEAIRGLQLSLSVSEIVNILERCPDIIEYLTLEKLVDKVEFLEKKIGFTPKQLRRILTKNPSVLTMGKNGLKEKTDFFLNSFNTTHDQVSKYPRVLQSPIKRLNERFLFLKQEELAGDDVKIRGWAFKIFAANSDEFFVDKVANKPLKKFRDFQEQMKKSQEK